MSQLKPEEVHRFWSLYEDRSIYKVVSFMDAVETWTADGDPMFEAAMTQLSEQFDNIGEVDLNTLGQEEALINVANSLHSGRALRYLQIIDIAHPGAASKLLIRAEEKSQSQEDAYGLFLRRNIVFERLRLLSRIFSQERFALVLKAIEGEDHV